MDTGTAPPEFSLSPGYYNKAQELRLNHEDPTATIYYTLDGSKPDERSNMYNDPLVISDKSEIPDSLSRIQETSKDFRLPREKGYKGTVVRAVAVLPGSPFSPEISGSWFVKKNGSEPYTMPIVSITADPDDLFDYHRGIYVLGEVFDKWKEANPEAQSDGSTPANYNRRGKNWSIPFKMDFFPSSADEVPRTYISGQGRMRTLGGWSRANPIKNLRLDFTKAFSYPLFDSRDYSRFQSLILRTSANDWNSTLFRDAYMTSLVDDILEVQASLPVIVFINGEYWGIHNLRERMTEDYISSLHKISPESVSILEGPGELAEGNKNGVEDYSQLLDYVRINDISQEQHYSYLTSRIDISNYIDYMASQIFFSNTDWPGNNIRFWKDVEADTPWRWLLYDTDFGFGLYEWAERFHHDTFSFVLEENGPDWPNPPWSTELFRALYSNEKFRVDFYTRLCDLINSRFSEESLLEGINRFMALYKPEIPEHILRWNNSGGSLSMWESEVDTMKPFASRRPDELLQMIMNKGNLEGIFKLDLIAETGGRVKINSLENIKGSWKGKYYKNLPLELEAIADPDYEFIGWTDTINNIHHKDTKFETLMSENKSITARFRKID